LNALLLLPFHHCITCNVSDSSILLEEIEFETVDTVEDNAAVYQGIVVSKFCVDFQLNEYL
jgi:hypothetical protein